MSSLRPTLHLLPLPPKDVDVATNPKRHMRLFTNGKLLVFITFSLMHFVWRQLCGLWALGIVTTA